MFLPQRRRLLQFRDYTWQSAFVDDDGYLAEMIASIVIGVPGVTRRGVTRTSGDLLDETEVKKGYRLDPNIDFVVRGQMRRARRILDLDYVPAELALPAIRAQLNFNACSVQRMVVDHSSGTGHILGDELGKTTAKLAMPIDSDGAQYLKLSRGSFATVADGTALEVCIRQERGHINFGNRSRQQLGAILSRHPIMVFYQHDARGRCQIVVVRTQLNSRQLELLLDEIYGDAPERRCQTQPYLMPDNLRQQLSTSPRHSVGSALRSRLLAVAVERNDGIDVEYWDPSGSLQVLDYEAQLTRVAPASECPPFRHSPRSLILNSEADRREAAQAFFEESIDGYYTGLRPYCELTSTTRNMAFGNLSQHLVSILTMIRGTRSGARGADLIEEGGGFSEVKLATGERGGDAMSTEDSPRLTLGWSQTKMLAWERLFAVRIVDQGDGLQVLVHAPTSETMAQFRRQVRAYFDGRVNNGSGGLQYHAVDPFPHDSYGPRERRLSFARVGQFKSGRAPKFPEALPEL